MKAFFRRYFWLLAAGWFLSITATYEVGSPEFIAHAYLAAACIMLWTVQRRANKTIEEATAHRATKPDNYLETLSSLSVAEKRKAHDEACYWLGRLNGDLKLSTLNFLLAAIGACITYAWLPPFRFDWLLLVWAFSFSISAGSNYTLLTKRPSHHELG